MIASEPVARIAAVVEPLRPVVDEVVIAADSRVDAKTLAGYGSLADRLFRIEYRMYERHLGWLHDQCSGDWILRIDSDEVPSQAFVDRLPGLVAARHVQQYWVPRAWLYPDAQHFLDEVPWSVDFLNRLVRNDGTLRFAGVQHAHADPVEPCVYIEEPVYHLDLLINTREQRAAKAILYEVARPGLTAPGGGGLNEAFYLPESRGSVVGRPVPLEDGATIARALKLTGTIASSDAGATEVSLEELDRRWEGRAVPPSAYRALIEPFERSIRMNPTEDRSIFFRVTNHGTEHWPWRLDQSPKIRVAYRWLYEDGSPHTAEGYRSPFRSVVAPGQSVLVPVQVTAPDQPGEYVLEVDLVHEFVSWFDCACRQSASIARPATLTQPGGRLREVAGPRRWPARTRIPPVFHRIWLGDRELPEAAQRFEETFRHHHPNWEMRLWTDQDLPALGITAEEQGRSRSPAELSNLMRYEILHRLGGVYVDTDIECLRPFTPLLRGITGFAALELPGRVCNAVLGAIPGLPAFALAAGLARKTLGLGSHSADANGPYLLTLILEGAPDVTIFGARLFYPFLWDQPVNDGDRFPDAYAIHHWAGSGRKSENFG